MFALSCAPLCVFAESSVTLTIHGDKPGPVVNPNIYGQFAEHLGHCIYGGIWVGEDSPIPNTRGIRNDVVAALKKIHIPVLRWPGGCFADEYHWRDGIGPRDKRPAMINTNWGGVVENNAFGTHEFFDFCEQIGATPYVNGNVGSGTVQEMMEWVEYMTSDADSPIANLRRQNGREKPWKLPFFGVGNESWGCGGNMRPEFYADNFRRYNTFVKNYPGNEIFRIACGPNSGDYAWTRTLMDMVGGGMNGLSLHYYTIPTGNWGKKGSATQFGDAEYYRSVAGAVTMDEYITKHSAIMNEKDPEKRIGLMVDEWGIWTDTEPGTNPGFLYQQNSLRDAIVAALNFNVFHRHADRVRMANIAQMVNVLQAMILTDGPKMVLTPTYHIFDMYKVHQGAEALPFEIKTPDHNFEGKSLPIVSATATRKDGAMHVSIVNSSLTDPVKITAKLDGVSATSAEATILTGKEVTSHNTFNHPNEVAPQPFPGVQLRGEELDLTIPAKSVITITCK